MSNVCHIGTILMPTHGRVGTYIMCTRGIILGLIQIHLTINVTIHISHHPQNFIGGIKNP